MKKIRSIGVIIMAIGIISALLGLFGCTKDPDDIVSGKVIKNTDPNAPKVIESDEIVDFKCEFYYFRVSQDSKELQNDRFNQRNYTLTAVLDGETVKSELSWNNNSGESQTLAFTTDKAFMKRLYEIVKKYDFAQYNGEYYKVSGLPHLFGSILSIKFASNETINATNGSNSFIEDEAMTELLELFIENTDVKFEYVPVIED